MLKKYENLQVELDTQNYKTIVKILESEKLEEFENIEDKKNKHNLEKTFILPLFGKFQANNFFDCS